MRPSTSLEGLTETVLLFSSLSSGSVVFLLVKRPQRWTAGAISSSPPLKLKKKKENSFLPLFVFRQSPTLNPRFQTQFPNFKVVVYIFLSGLSQSEKITFVSFYCCRLLMRVGHAIENWIWWNEFGGLCGFIFITSESMNRCLSFTPSRRENIIVCLLAVCELLCNSVFYYHCFDATPQRTVGCCAVFPVKIFNEKHIITLSPLKRNVHAVLLGFAGARPARHYILKLDVSSELIRQ